MRSVSTPLLSLINPATDTLMPAADVVEQATGKRPSRTTIWRWVCGPGRRGCHLQAFSQLGGWYTTREAYAAFITGQTASALGGGDAE
jgi:hypothetical protein